MQRKINAIAGVSVEEPDWPVCSKCEIVTESDRVVSEIGSVHEILRFLSRNARRGGSLDVVKLLQLWAKARRKKD